VVIGLAVVKAIVQSAEGFQNDLDSLR